MRHSTQLPKLAIVVAIAIVIDIKFQQFLDYRSADSDSDYEYDKHNVR